jgi:hypothetical protein
MRRALGALLALLTGGVLAEIAVRLTPKDEFGPLRLVPWDVVEPVVAGMKVDEAASYLIFDPDLGWQVGPGRRSLNGLYHSNDAGERVSAPAVGAAPPWATAFGDSFTHGDDVRDEETWLEGLGARGLPAVNLGVPGYGVDQAWLRYRRMKSGIRSRVVLIGVMADNIARHLNRYRPFITPVERVFFVKPRFEGNQDSLRLVLSPFRTREEYARRPEVLLAALREVGARDSFYDPRLYETSAFDRSKLFRIVRTLRLDPARHADWRPLYRDEAAVALTLAIVRGFVEEVRGDGRVPAIVFMPDRTVAADVAEGRTPPTGAFLDRLRGFGVPLIDLTEVAARFGRKPDADAAFLPHYSPALSRAVADYIAGWKKTEKSLP